MQDRAQRTRERILDAAAEEFATHGHEGTTLQAVADRVGMTKGAVYGHFTSKQAVAAALEAYGALALSALHPDSRAPDPVDTLRRLVGEFGARLQSDIRLRAALRLHASHPAAQPPTVLSDLLRHTSETVRAAQEEGAAAADHPPHLIAGCLLTLACAGAGAAAPEELRPRPRDAQEVTDIALKLLNTP
ncbi:helix-turn-helix domain-containing protein [Streptomyces sp. NPDC086182]|jgi:AcrR family transcriptional regulator|uniref:helix-turn-helix domain-containing protein n=1 Tax=Streptomyces sp. NPDC086182 TaxID=3155058 RepID=UPI0034189CA4